MDRFVVGFAFTTGKPGPDCKVLLMKKSRPKWQMGLLNGIGGKIEGDETPARAMERECMEETGLRLDWTCRGLLNGTNLDGRPFECHLFYAYSPTVADFKQKEDEPLGLYSLSQLPGLDTVPSLDFLIPFGISKDQQPFMTLTY